VLKTLIGISADGWMPQCLPCKAISRLPKSVA